MFTCQDGFAALLSYRALSSATTCRFTTALRVADDAFSIVVSSAMCCACLWLHAWIVLNQEPDISNTGLLLITILVPGVMLVRLPSMSCSSVNPGGTM